MPKRAIIPFVPPTGEEVRDCASYYKVRYRRDDQDGWTSIVPNPLVPPFTIPFLPDGFGWVVEVQQICCDGTEGTVQTTTFSTNAETPNGGGGIG